MFAFERFNKRIKKLCRHRHLAMESLARSCTLDMATRLKYFNRYKNVKLPVCVLGGQPTWYHPSDVEIKDMKKVGTDIIDDIVCSHDIAVIAGIQFHADEWGSVDSFCGSVVVTKVHGTSRYCIVWRFIEVGEEIFACVQWFDVPQYEYFPNTLVVSVTVAEDDEQRRLGSVLNVKHIITTRVFILPNSDGVTYNLMRESGTD